MSSASPARQTRFQYTGQKWIGELGFYDYKARMYAPALGRFLQIDPVGYGSGPNLYAYVRGDPVNFVDPLGLRLNDTFDRAYYDLNANGEIIPEAGAIVITGSCGSYCTSAAPGNVTGLPTPPTNIADNQGGGATGGEILVVCDLACQARHKPKPTPPSVPTIVPIPTIGVEPASNIMIAAQLGRRENKCKEAAHLCLERNPSGRFWHQQCMELERLCRVRSKSMYTLGNDGKTEGWEYCVGSVGVRVDRHGFVEILEDC